MAISENFDQLAVEQAEKEVVLNEIMRSVRAGGTFGLRASTTNGLTLGYYGGYALLSGSTPTAIQDGTVVLSASSTNYVECDNTGTVSKNTVGFTTGSLPIYVITTGTYGMTSIVDWRSPYNLVSAGGGGSGGALPFMGCLAKLSGNLTGVNYSTPTVVPWDAEVRDTNGFHSTVTNNSRITIPSGLGIATIKLTGQIRAENVTATSTWYLNIRKNGAVFDGAAYTTGGDEGGTTLQIQVTTANIQVVAGDYFELQFQCSDTSIDIASNLSWFEMEVIETTLGSNIRAPMLMGATVYRSAALTGIDTQSGTYFVPWDAETFDTHNFHDNSTNPSRLTIPAGYGIKKVKISGSARGNSYGTAGGVAGQLYKNGSQFALGPQQLVAGSIAAGAFACSFSSGPIDVVEGDYFEFRLWNSADNSIDLNTTGGSFFSIEVLEANPIACREVLLADTTLYVATTGSDTNNGRTAATPFLTIQKALDVIADTMDTAGYTATIKLADGTYSLTSTVTAKAHVGKNPIIIEGNTSTPANVVVQSNAAVALETAGQGARIKVRAFKLQANSSNTTLLRADFGSYVIIDTGMDFGTSGTESQIMAMNRGFIEVSGNYTISGGGGRHMYVARNSSLLCTGFTITLTGTPAFSLNFISANELGFIRHSACTFSGSATGQRYNVAMNSVINTNGGGSTYFPGSTAGVTGTGGIYA